MKIGEPLHPPARQGDGFQRQGNLVRDALPGTTVRFGTGRLIVNTGVYGDEPAVFVDAAPYRGVVGEKAPDVPAGTPAMLRLLFPTREQAKAVCDALVMPDAP
jgi:hypothetical protein